MKQTLTLLTSLVLASVTALGADEMLKREPTGTISMAARSLIQKAVHAAGLDR